jgi:V8-like Glu-specific endopeptidase
MTVFPFADSRLVTTNLTSFPLNAVATIDSQFQRPVAVNPNLPINQLSAVGTGIMISPNHVLTAAHNVVDIFTRTTVNNVTTYNPIPLSSVRISTSASQLALQSRTIGVSGDSAPNVILNSIYFPRNANTQSIRLNDSIDVALLRSTVTPIAAQDVIGMIAFVDTKASSNLSITTAGYPIDPPRFNNNGRTLVISPGTGIETVKYTTPGMFYYDVDTGNGQSGSAVWHTLNGDRPRTLGIHTRGYGNATSNETGGNAGVLITTDLYDKIVSKIAADSGTSNANLLPENAIIGVDIAQPGVSIDDTIVGSYRKERIQGKGGDDKLFGGGADDRLEGGAGIDQALFADVTTNYKITNTDIFNGFFTIEHIGGTKADGKDSLQGIETAVFGFVDANKDKIDDDGIFNVVPLNISPLSIQPFSSTAEIGFSATSRSTISVSNQQASSGPKLKDGPEITTSQTIFGEHEQEIGVFETTTSAWTVDGDVNYKLSILPAKSANSLVLDRQAIENISIKVNDKVVDVIDPSQFTMDSQDNLSFMGEIADLTTGQDAYNDVSFELIFTDCLDSITLEQQITGGQELNTVWSADEETEINVLNVIEAEFIAPDDGVNRDIYGNNFVNSITVSSGHNNLSGEDGNDRFILCGGENVVDGGADVDTVRINMNYEDAGHITRTGNSIKIGDDTTLSNTEFIEFDDIRLATSDLTVTPIISLTESVVSVTEGASKTANITVNLSSVVDRDVAIEYSTQSISAVAGSDFTESKGTLTIAAGESSGHITINIAEDLIPEGFEQLVVNLKTISGETFADNTNESTVNINISDNDSAIGVSLIADNSTLGEGTQPISLQRFGSLTAADTLKFQVVAAGSNPAQASDFTNGFTEGQFSFAPGESIKEIEIPIALDQDIESDETFGLRLIGQSGLATVPSDDLIFTIRDYGQIEQPIEGNPVMPAVNAAEDDLLLGRQSVDTNDVLTEYTPAKQDFGTDNISDIQTDIFSSSATQDSSLSNDVFPLIQPSCTGRCLTNADGDNKNNSSIFHDGFDAALSFGSS